MSEVSIHIIFLTDEAGNVGCQHLKVQLDVAVKVLIDYPMITLF